MIAEMDDQSLESEFYYNFFWMIIEIVGELQWYDLTSLLLNIYPITGKPAPILDKTINGQIKCLTLGWVN